MADFSQLRDDLIANRREREDARAEAVAAAEQLKLAERDAARARRSADPRDSALDADERLQEAASRARSAASRLAAFDRTGSKLATDLSQFTDPVEGISLLSARYPILLMPVRIETRFKPSSSGQPQLWVRIYPDDCLVDGFEEALTKTEVEKGTAFWASIWQALGDEAKERAAWRSLVASSGAGRAGWIVRRLLPANSQDKPEEEDGVVRLILVAEEPQPQAVLDYWNAVWTAGKDGPQLNAARNALDAALVVAGAERVVSNPPFNIDEKPPAGEGGLSAKVSVLQIPKPDPSSLRDSSWSSAPRVDVLPDRFVLLAYDGSGSDPQIELGNPIAGPLAAGPDPNAAPDQQLKPSGVDPDHPDTLQIPDALKWMFDFEAALEAGMAFRFDLTADQAQKGFDRLVVLGVRLTDTPKTGGEALGRLLEHHLFSRKGLELLAQGTPTNNSDGSGSGYSWREDPDVSFEPLFKQHLAFDSAPASGGFKDGQYLASALGLPPAFVAQIPGAGLSDRAEAEAMQIALWPATIGYFMDALMDPVFTDAVVNSTRSFFTRHVSGRGPLPALRIGMQPYGILPITAFSRLAWFNDDARDGAFFDRLVSLIRSVESDYRNLLPQVSRIGADHEDSGQALLDVLGLHPGSVEYYPLLADSLDHKAHELSFFDAALVTKLLAAFPQDKPIDLLHRLGYSGSEIPDLLTKIYRSRETPLDGPVIDDVPLSEQNRIRPYAAGRNYIEWLIAAAQDSVAAVQAEQGFDGNKRPKALLYLLLRHGVQLDFREAAFNLMLDAGILAQADAIRREPAFVHVADGQGLASESRYALLFETAPQITNDDDLKIGDYVARHARVLEKSLLPEHLQALDLLSKLPTARLERLFAEHIDTVSYRLDAWKTGVVNVGLELLRSARRSDHVSILAGQGGAVEGLYLGAFGWVEQLRPENKNLQAVELPDDLGSRINAHDSVPLMKDPTNLGLIHAPSINHAATAAVLRNAYVAHGGKLAVNLSSRRVRTALSILEGMREGQSLGALLGYHFERHVHDHGPLTVRALIYPLRRAFPLAANQIASTVSEDGEAKESIAAMNVVDGRKLILHVEQNDAPAYPFEVAALPRGSADQEQALSNALSYIRDINDAVADLILSEGVHQAVLGNYERSAAVTDAFSKGSSPPSPDVIRTPRPGTQLSMRTAIHVTPGASNPWPAVPMTPLALAEPALNHWVAKRLPMPGTVAVLVDYVDRNSGSTLSARITQEELGLQAADLLYRTEPRSDQVLGALDDLILARLHQIASVSLGDPIKIRHTSRIDGFVTFFELEALLRSLRRLVLGTRPLRSADLVRQSDAEDSKAGVPVLDVGRLAAARTALHDTHLPALEALKTAVADMSRTIDELILLFTETVAPVAAYRIPGAASGFAFERRAAIYTSITAILIARAHQWNQKLASYDAVMAEFVALDPAAGEDVRLQLLRTAESLVSMSVTGDQPSAALLPIVSARRDAFADKRDALVEVATVPRATLIKLADDAVAVSDLTGFDHDALDLSRPVDDIARFREDLLSAVSRLIDSLNQSIAGLDEASASHATAPEADKAAIVVKALQAIFGDDFVSIPEFKLQSDAATEFAQALAQSQSGELTKHLTEAPPAGSGRDFPEEDWLHGIARVRAKMQHLENVILLSDALPGATAPSLMPIQLPFEAGQPWLALELPDGFDPSGERLLYTACFEPGFDPSASIAGLLADEWPEVIPARQLTTGVAFHHDKPNAEPPQSWLLALPATLGQTWTWDDFVGAVSDALDSAKLRAIEPVHLEGTAYSAFVPATHSPWTYPEISISNNLLKNIDIFERLERESP